MGKHKVLLWNISCLTILCCAFFFILPYILHPTTPIVEKAPISPPITEIGSKKQLWKRGDSSFSTIIKEDKASSTLDGEQTHSAEGWTYIRWRKENDS